MADFIVVARVHITRKTRVQRGGREGGGGGGGKSETRL